MLRPINGHCRARRRKPWNPGNAPPRKPDVIETASKAAPLADGLETPRRHWATLTLLLAITLTVFDASMANVALPAIAHALRSEEHTAELQSLMRISYAVFCLIIKKPKQ